MRFSHPVRLRIAALLVLAGCGAGRDPRAEKSWDAYKAFTEHIFRKQFAESHAMVAGSPSRGWEAALEAEAGSSKYAFQSVEVKKVSQVVKSDQVTFNADVTVSYSGNFGAGFFPPARHYRQVVTMTMLGGEWKVGRLEFKSQD